MPSAQRAQSFSVMPSNHLCKGEALLQDIEFTVQDGSLYLLQCRSGKRTGVAAVAIACDFVDAGLVGIPDAVMMVEPRQLDQVLQPQFASGLSYADSVIAQGIPASPGAAGQCWVAPEPSALAVLHHANLICMTS